MSVCPKCGEEINTLLVSRTNREDGELQPTGEISLDEGSITEENYSCPECLDIIFNSADNAIEFLNTKEEEFLKCPECKKALEDTDITVIQKGIGLINGEKYMTVESNDEQLVSIECHSCGYSIPLDTVKSWDWKEA